MHWIAFATLAILALASRAAPANAAELHLEDVVFLLYAMEVDRSQVRLGQLATDKAQEERVRQYGRFMINDHQRANARVTKIAAEYGVEPPQEVSPVAQRMQEWLQRLSRAQFDDQYIATQVIYHYSAHYLYKRENLHGRDEQLRREAGQQVEILEAHRSAAEQIARQLPPSQARLHAEDLTFLLYAMDIDLTQVQLSRLAAEKAGNERVRQFAGRMLDYHTGSYQGLARFAQENGIEPLQELGPIARKMQERLRQLTGATFDWQYINTQVIFHYAAFYRYERESIHGRDKQLQGFGAEAFRDVKQHHDEALAIVRDWIHDVNRDVHLVSTFH